MQAWQRQQVTGEGWQWVGENLNLRRFLSLKPRYIPLFPNISALKEASSSFILVMDFWNSDITFILLYFLARLGVPQRNHGYKNAQLHSPWH